MKINKKTIRTILLFFTFLVLLFTFMSKIGADSLVGFSPSRSGYIESISWKEVWERKYAILSNAFLFTLVCSIGIVLFSERKNKKE